MAGISVTAKLGQAHQRGRVARANEPLSPATVTQMNGTLCATCSRVLRRGLTFAFKTSQGETIRCLYCSLLHWPMLRRSLVTALVVGTVLILLNHGDKIFSGSWPAALYWKIPLTYSVPFLVASWGALTSSRR